VTDSVYTELLSDLSATDPYPDPYSHKIPGLPYEHSLTPDFDSMSTFLRLFRTFLYFFSTPNRIVTGGQTVIGHGGYPFSLVDVSPIRIIDSGWTTGDSAMASTQNGYFNSYESSHEMHIPLAESHGVERHAGLSSNTTRPVILEQLSRHPCMRPDILEKIFRKNEKKNVSSYKTLSASARRRTVTAKFICPEEGCDSSFTRKYNLTSGSISMHR